MLASPTYHISDSGAVQGAALWLLTAFLVFWTIDGLATRPHAVHIEAYREAGLTDEQVLSIALQEARAAERNGWWIHDRESYIVFDADRTYAISDAAVEAFGLRLTVDTARNPIALVEANRAGVPAAGPLGR